LLRSPVVQLIVVVPIPLPVGTGFGVALIVGAVWGIRDVAAVASGFVVPAAALGCFEESQAAKKRHITTAAIEIVAFIIGATPFVIG